MQGDYIVECTKYKIKYSRACSSLRVFKIRPLYQLTHLQSPLSVYFVFQLQHFLLCYCRLAGVASKLTSRRDCRQKCTYFLFRGKINWHFKLHAFELCAHCVCHSFWGFESFCYNWKVATDNITIERSIPFHMPHTPREIWVNFVDYLSFGIPAV